jgi:hypothetical protein
MSAAGEAKARRARRRAIAHTADAPADRDIVSFMEAA